MSKKVSGKLKSGVCTKGIVTYTNVPNQKKRIRHNYKNKPNEDDYFLKINIEGESYNFELTLENIFEKILNFLREIFLF